MREYNKLVRDNIADIIEAKGEKCITRILDNKEYIEELNKKLGEEVNEYLASGEVEELADIEEVLRAILDAKNITYGSFEELRLGKVERRGAFSKRVFLEKTYDKDETI